MQYTTHTRQVVEDVLKSSVLGEEDAAYIESYGSSLSSDGSSDINDGILGQMLTYVLLIFFVTRWIYVIYVYFSHDIFNKN